MGHSIVSGALGLVGQPRLQKHIQKQVGDSLPPTASRHTAGLIASAIVSPIYVVTTNPLGRLEVIMQTSSIDNGSTGRITVRQAVERSICRCVGLWASGNIPWSRRGYDKSHFKSHALSRRPTSARGSFSSVQPHRLSSLRKITPLIVTC